MSFLYPAFLFALLALIIPVIIHLFNFKRYKTLYFSNVPLLKLIRQESIKKSQLKQLLILLARILALTSLVFAFSRPIIPLSNRKSTASQQQVGIYIDNSFSMKAEGEKGQLLEQARLKAIEIANSYQIGTQFLLITNDFLPQQQFLLNKEQFIQQVSEIKDSPHSVAISEVYQYASRIFSTSGLKSDRTMYLLSDFQKYSSDFEKIKPDSTIYANLLCFEAGKTNNLLIDSCWFEIPGRKIGQQEKLMVRIKNLSEQAYQNIPVRLTINDSLKAISTINLAEHEESVLELNYTNNSTGIQLCKVELDDYPIIYDNSYFLSYIVQGKLHAMGIINTSTKNPDYLKELFTDDELISYIEFPENNVQISQFKNQQCIFLINNQKISSGIKNELVLWVRQGGSLVVFPEKLGNYDEYNDLLTALNGKTITAFDTASIGISEINYENDLYKNAFKKQEKEADLPRIKGSVKFSDQEMKPETWLLKFKNGRNALTEHSVDDGKVYVFAFPLNNLNIKFISHIIFVPTVYNMVLNSGVPQKYSYSIDSNEPVILNHLQALSGDLKIRNMQTNDEFLAPVRTIGNGQKTVSLEELPKIAGHYLILNGNEPIQAVSYNYSRKESVPEFYTKDELKNLIQTSKFKQFQVIEPSDINFTETLQELNNGRQLWKYFIILAIFFLLCEVAIVRFWK